MKSSLMPVGLPATKVLKTLYYSRSEKSFPAASTGVDGLEGIRVMAPEQTLAKANSLHIRVEARPASIDIDSSRSGVIVVDTPAKMIVAPQSALLAMASGQEVVDFIHHQHARPDPPQDIAGQLLQARQRRVRTLRRTHLKQERSIKAALIRRRWLDWRAPALAGHAEDCAPRAADCLPGCRRRSAWSSLVRKAQTTT